MHLQDKYENKEKIRVAFNERIRLKFQQLRTTHKEPIVINRFFDFSHYNNENMIKQSPKLLYNHIIRPQLAV
jgi:hypothetical protein